MRNYNPYLLLYLIPLALVTGAIYYVIAIESTLSAPATIFSFSLIVLTVLFMVWNIRRSNVSLVEEDPVEVAVRKIIEIKKIDLTDEEMAALLKEAKDIYRSAHGRAEKTTRLKILVDKYIQKTNG